VQSVLDRRRPVTGNLQDVGVVGPEPIVFDSDGMRLVADRWSPGTVDRQDRGTVVLLHGGGQRRHSWHATGRRLADHGWTVVAPDARGHGDSDWSPDGDYSLDALVGDLATIVHSLRAPVSLIGASMGGMTALVGQGERADLAKALVLVDVVPRLEPAGVRRIMDFMSAAPGGFGSLDEVVEAIRAYNPHRKRPPTRDGVRRNVRQRADGRWYWHWDPAVLRTGDEPTRAARYQRLRAAAASIRVPTLVVRGGQSDIVSPEGVRELLELIPGAQQVEVTDAGHMVAGDDNDVFTEHVVEFLRGAVGANARAHRRPTGCRSKPVTGTTPG
jgi:pimeloyl-ACP methyl ester carboxylesterase